ncbi:MAG TPA: lysine--tRNA ligase [Phycisphaerae bacterium]|nr:lysine--tRNA ligase [Phycisphaerae bacterium]
MLEKVQADRLAKLQQIRDLGIDPYGGRYDTAEAVGGILARFAEAERAGAADGLSADAAGRLVLIRDMGRMIFAHLRDSTGQMQIALRKNALDETAWKLAKLLDLGDLIAVAGPLHRTKTNEITIWAERLTLLTKSLDPMPEKFHGLVDTEIRYRQRYLDLMTNPESMARFGKRVEIIEHMRQKLNARGFMEVETPVLQPIYGGAAARPFTTHHNTLDCDLFLRISPELYLKRLLVGGMEKVFEIGRVFRNEGISTQHSPEYTLLELYQAYADYEVMMEITEELIATAAERECGRMRVPYGDRELDLTPPWDRKTYDELLREHAGVSMRDPAAVRAEARQLGIEEADKADAVVVNAVFGAVVEPELAKMGRPIFVTDYPAELCPLTRRKADDPSIALRFECYIAGMEIANAYTELNDPAVQEANLREQLRGEAADETMRVMDEDFITALRHGMPPAGGLGIGIDRVVMLLTNTQSIRDIVLFPLLRPT